MIIKMELNNIVSVKEREHLRELAKKQLELSQLPIMKERENLWFQHNELKGTRPMVIMEDITFWDEICPTLQCESSLAREIEEELYKNIVIVDLLDDDKVVTSYYKLNYELKYKKYGLEPKVIYAADGLGFHVVPEIEEIEEDFEKLSPSIFEYDEVGLKHKKEMIEEIIGDILPVRLINATNQWGMSLTHNVVDLMGTENMFCSMLTEPDEFHRLMEFVTDDSIRLLRFQEEMGIMQVNNRNDYMGSGSYCFNNEIGNVAEGDAVKSIDTWGHINSQESVGISPAAFQEFILPYILKLSKEFGLLYYGCCEPVSDFWKEGVEKIENLRKVSISPWCNEEMMAEQLAGSKTIYSRKPSPNFIGIEANFDEVGFREYIRTTAKLINNCKAEFIFRDIYKLHGNIEKVKKAVQITREETRDCY
ncbi:MAG: hypothetical protein R3Y24_12845 [Eubacteriales bacterium]